MKVAANMYYQKEYEKARFLLQLSESAQSAHIHKLDKSTRLTLISLNFNYRDLELNIQLPIKCEGVNS